MFPLLLRRAGAPAACLDHAFACEQHAQGLSYNAKSGKTNLDLALFSSEPKTKQQAKKWAKTGIRTQRAVGTSFDPPAIAHLLRTLRQDGSCVNPQRIRLQATQGPKLKNSKAVVAWIKRAASLCNLKGTLVTRSQKPAGMFIYVLRCGDAVPLTMQEAAALDSMVQAAMMHGPQRPRKGAAGAAATTTPAPLVKQLRAKKMPPSAAASVTTFVSAGIVGGDDEQAADTVVQLDGVSVVMPREAARADQASPTPVAAAAAEAGGWQEESELEDGEVRDEVPETALAASASAPLLELHALKQAVRQAQQQHQQQQPPLPPPQQLDHCASGHQNGIDMRALPASPPPAALASTAAEPEQAVLAWGQQNVAAQSGRKTPPKVQTATVLQRSGAAEHAQSMTSQALHAPELQPPSVRVSAMPEVQAPDEHVLATASLPPPPPLPHAPRWLNEEHALPAPRPAVSMPSPSPLPRLPPLPPPLEQSVAAQSCCLPAQHAHAAEQATQPPEATAAAPEGIEMLEACTSRAATDVIMMTGAADGAATAEDILQAAEAQCAQTPSSGADELPLSDLALSSRDAASAPGATAASCRAATDIVSLLSDSDDASGQSVAEIATSTAAGAQRESNNAGQGSTAGASDSDIDIVGYQSAAQQAEPLFDLEVGFALGAGPGWSAPDHVRDFTFTFIACSV